MAAKQTKAPYVCQCQQCVADPIEAIAQLHVSVNQMVAVLNEKHRRQFVGLLALQLGHGGIKSMAEVTGLSRNTIARGQREIKESDFSERVRAVGAGRPVTEKKSLGC